MRLKGIRVLFLAAFLAAFVQEAQAVPPPHPDLLNRIRSGLAEEPEFLLQLREKGPHDIGRERNFQPLLRKKELLRRAGKKTELVPAEAPVVESQVLGTQKVLVLLVAFSDIPAQADAEDFDSLVFGDAAPSMKHYYQEVSRGGLILSTDNLPSVKGWLTLPQNKEYYRTNLSQMARDAVAAADDGTLDFSSYDNDLDGFVDYLVIVHVGRGGELLGDNTLIWSQVTTVSPAVAADGVQVDTFMTVPEYWVSPNPGPADVTDMTVGVYAHEFGHLLGLPDLYDIGGDSHGIGDWGLMGHGMWNGTIPRGESPSWLSAWSRIALGWETPQIPVTNQTGVSFGPVETGGSIYYLWNDGVANTEFFLLENRQQVGYDAFLPSHGLLIWHVDEAMTSNASQIPPPPMPPPPPSPAHHNDCSYPLHYKVALQQSDGFMNLEFYSNPGDPGDPYPGIFAKTEFSLATTPNSGSYADCGSLVAVRSISETVGADVVADIDVTGPPNLAFSSYSSTSSLLPGQSAPLTVNVVNNGGVATGIAATLVSLAADITVTQPSSAYPLMVNSDTASNVPDFDVQVGGAAIPGTAVDMQLQMTADGGYAATLDFQIVVEPADPVFTFSGTAAASELLPGANSLLDVTVANGGSSASSVTATLQALSPAVVTVTQGSSLYGDIPYQGSAVNSTPFEVQVSPSAVPGTMAAMRLQLTAVDEFTDTIDFSLLIEPAAPVLTIAGSSGGAPLLPGSTIALTVQLENNGGGATGLNGTLQSLDPLVTVPDEYALYPPIAYTETAGNGSDPFLVHLGHRLHPGGTVDFVIHLGADGGYTADLPFQVVLDPATGGNPNQPLLLMRDGTGGIKEIMALEWEGGSLSGPFDRGDINGWDDFLLRGDVNGDGLGDLVRGRILGDGTVEWDTHLARWAYLDVDPVVIFTDDLPAPWHAGLGSGESRFFLGDVDGDGNEDLIIADPDPATPGWFLWRAALSTGESFGDAQLWSSPFGRLPRGRFLVGDVDGGGRSDLLWGRWKRSSRNKVRWRAALSQGDSFGGSVLWTMDAGRSSGMFHLGDVDGDSLADLVFALPRSKKWKPFRWKAALSRGDSFSGEALWLSAFGRRTWAGLAVTDLDGTGPEDLLGWREKDGRWYVYGALSSGAAFSGQGIVGDFPSLPGDRPVP